MVYLLNTQRTIVTNNSASHVVARLGFLLCLTCRLRGQNKTSSRFSDVRHRITVLLVLTKQNWTLLSSKSIERGMAVAPWKPYQWRTQKGASSALSATTQQTPKLTHPRRLDGHSRQQSDCGMMLSTPFSYRVMECSRRPPGQLWEPSGSPSPALTNLH
jgi:hypothetical protein